MYSPSHNLTVAVPSRLRNGGICSGATKDSGYLNLGWRSPLSRPDRSPNMGGKSMPTRQVDRPDDIRQLRVEIRQHAQSAREQLNQLDCDGMEAFFGLKFEDKGRHPLEDRPLDFIEQLNQTFTYLVSLAAAEKLMEWFPDCGGLRLHLGATPGWDIESRRPGLIEAETFAAKAPTKNGKLGKDVERLADSSADHRYVFFFAKSEEGETGRRLDLEEKYRTGTIRIWVLTREELMG